MGAAKRIRTLSRRCNGAPRPGLRAKKAPAGVGSHAGAEPAVGRGSRAAALVGPGRFAVHRDALQPRFDPRTQLGREWRVAQWDRARLAFGFGPPDELEQRLGLRL